MESKKIQVTITFTYTPQTENGAYDGDPLEIDRAAFEEGAFAVEELIDFADGKPDVTFRYV